MALLPILTWPDPRLSQPCLPVGRCDADLRGLAQDMLDTMYAAPGRGLAAPQVGVMLRLFVMDPTWKEGQPAPVVCVNPAILWRSADTALGPEVCLSIPGVSAGVARATAIDLGWTDLDGAPQHARLTGFAAICAQHEYDHLDGILTLDHLGAEARQVAEAANAQSPA